MFLASRRGRSRYTVESREYTLQFLCKVINGILRNNSWRRHGNLLVYEYAVMRDVDGEVRETQCVSDERDYIQS